MDDCEVHVELVVRGAREGATQHVPAQPLPDGTFKILYSPGFVEGVAAGDIIRLSDRKKGAFDVVSRGGNVCIQVFRTTTIRPVAEWLLAHLAPLSARLDGSIERAVVFTLPVSAGFRAIEKVMAEAVAAFHDIEWHYGNVYAEDGKTPLNWW